LCQERGWLIVAPRLGLGFGLGNTFDAEHLVQELGKRYPIDPKHVFLVGHSMGASMSVDAVQKAPGLFAALVTMGGGGRVRQADAFKTLPILVAVGDKDFALGTAKSLHKALIAGQAERAELKVYPDLEHLVIVREALVDAFKLYDSVIMPGK
jgi:predicted peptidase